MRPDLALSLSVCFQSEQEENCLFYLPKPLLPPRHHHYYYYHHHQHHQADSTVGPHFPATTALALFLATVKHQSPLKTSWITFCTDADSTPPEVQRSDAVKKRTLLLDNSHGRMTFLWFCCSSSCVH